MPSNEVPQYFYRVRLDMSTDDAPLYVADHPELPGCMAHGATASEALLNLADARQLYITDLRERSLPIPPPESAVGREPRNDEVAVPA